MRPRWVLTLVWAVLAVSASCLNTGSPGWRGEATTERLSAVVSRCMPQGLKTLDANHEAAWTFTDQQSPSLSMTITLTWRDDSRRRLDGMQVAVAGSAQDRTPANGARFRELVKCVLSPDLAPERVRDRLLSLLDRSKPPATETARVDRFQLGLVDTHPRTPGFTLMVSVMGPRS